jgi:hypothetical protein
MTEESHIEPSKHSTKEVDEKLRQVEVNMGSCYGAGSPAIKPEKNLDDDGRRKTDTQRQVFRRQTALDNERPERDLPSREVPDERDPDAPDDKGDVEIKSSRRKPADKRSYVGEAGTPTK